MPEGSKNSNGVAAASPRKSAGKRRQIIISTVVFLALVSLMRSSSSSSSPTPNGMGDADLTYLKTNAELSRNMAQLASSIKQQESFSLAKNESGGFFTDIRDTTWKMFKLKARAMQPNTRGDPRRTTDDNIIPTTWFQNHYEPDFTCPFERRFGRLGDGGKWVCDPHRITMKAKEKGCLVYSVGSNGDASFEAAILQDVSPDCEIHIFDFDDYTDAVKQQTEPSTNVHYHQWGISNVTNGEFKTLQDTVQELGHSGRTVDLFKIDCEGCELDTFDAWFQANVILKQILVEVHYELGIGRPHKMRLPQTVDLFECMYKEGYVITHKEPNIEYSGHHGICVEYNFLLLSTAFWKGNVAVTGTHATR